jgi:transposase InsO family protein
LKIKFLRLDNICEFNSNEFRDFYEENGTKRHFSIANTPQQSGVIERKNKTIHEMAITMLNDSKLSDIFWEKSLDTTVHILNKGLNKNISDKTPYEVCKGRIFNVKYFGVFRSKCYIKREDKNNGNFDSQEDEGIFVRYS